MSYFGHIQQEVVADAGNSSVSNLAAGAVFTGVLGNTLIGAGIQVTLKADQDCAVYVIQAPQNTNVTGKGTVAANDGTTITGTGTQFTKDFVKGDTFTFDSAGTPLIRIVDVVSSDTVMTVTVATTGGALTGKAYTHLPMDIRDYSVYRANENFGVTIQAVASYYMVRIINISATTTQVFRLQSCLCPIVESLPRTLDANGNLKVSLKEDLQGNHIENSPHSELEVVERSRLVGSTFSGNKIDPLYWHTDTATGTVTQSGGNVTVTSGTANGHYAAIHTGRFARYITGASNKFRGHIRLADLGTANVKRRWGVGTISNYLLTITSASVVAGGIYTNNGQQFTVLKTETSTTISVYGTGAPGAGAQTYVQVVGSGGNLTGSTFAAQYVITDGAYFQLDGTTFSVVTCKGTTEAAVASGNFNGQLGLFYLPTTNNTVYEIGYSNSTVVFSINNIPIHKVIASAATWTNTVHLFAFTDATNSGNSSAVAHYSRALNIVRIGKLSTNPSTFHGTAAATTVLKYQPGLLTRICCNFIDTGTLITIYDGIAAGVGPVMGIIQPGAKAVQPFVMEYGLQFDNGLTLVSTGTWDYTAIFE